MAEEDSTSKKPSAANWLSKLHNPPTFFLDRSLGRLKIAAALRQAGATVEVHDDLFHQGAADEVWLQAAGEKSWVVLTKDKNIRYHAREKTTLLAYGVRAFVLTAKALNADEMAATFVKALPEIVKLLESSDGPFVATVTRQGVIRVVLTASGPQK
jgi:predicted nuclease of predicted toxin-antitoxin system